MLRTLQMTTGTIILLILFAFGAGAVLGMFLARDCCDCDENQQPVRRES